MHVKEGMYRIDGGAAGPQAFPFGEVRAQDLIIEKKYNQNHGFFPYFFFFFFYLTILILYK